MHTEANYSTSLWGLMTRRDHTHHHHHHLWRGKTSWSGGVKPTEVTARLRGRWRWIIRSEWIWDTEKTEEQLRSEREREREVEERLEFDCVNHSQVWRVWRGYHLHIEVFWWQIKAIHSLTASTIKPPCWAGLEGWASWLINATAVVSVHGGIYLQPPQCGPVQPSKVWTARCLMWMTSLNNKCWLVYKWAGTGKGVKFPIFIQNAISI